MYYEMQLYDRSAALDVLHAIAERYRQSSNPPAMTLVRTTLIAPARLQSELEELARKMQIEFDARIKNKKDQK